MSKVGRPLKPNVIRDKRGKSRGEPMRIDREVLAVRVKLLQADGFSEKFAQENADNSLAGYTLGKLLMRHRIDKTDPSGVSPEQYGAGESWCRIVHRHAAIMGYALRTKTPNFIMVSGGLSCGKEVDEETILRVRGQFRDCYNALADVTKYHGKRPREVCYGVCVENWPMNALYERDYGDLKLGLNTLARVLR